MKAFTTFRSNSIITERLLGSSSPRVAAPCVSDKPQFCFSLKYSRNDKKSSHFWFLKLVQNKGIYPVHVVPSKNQVDLETIEPQAQQSDQTNADESQFVRVAFQLQKNCDFGEQFLIVGDDPVLGSWEPSDALPMTWSDGHLWTVELDVPAGKSIQYKFILKGKEGRIIWQPGSDRIVNTWETVNRITVFEDWENAELQKIIEGDEVSQPNEEPLQVVSEVSTSTEILDNPQEELVSNASKISGIEDTQIYAEEKPVAEPVLHQITGDNNSISSSMEKPMAIIAENIGPSEDLMEDTNSEKNEKNERDAIQQSEESADGPSIHDIIYGLEYNGNAAPLKNQDRTIVEDRLFDFEGGPVLVPGLISLTEEAGPGEVEEKSAMDPPIEAFETRDQKDIPEFSKEQESDEGTPQEEISATINDDNNDDESELLDNDEESELLGDEHEEQESDEGTPQEEISATINDNNNDDESKLLGNKHEEQSHLVPTTTMEEERPNSEPVEVYGNDALQNDIQWGRETVKKFLTKLGLL